MPVDIVEMLWQCPIPSCGAVVLGRFKACSRCGQFRTPDVDEWMPDIVSHNAAVTDAFLLNKFTGGVDRHCEFCGSSQWNVDKCCQRCGSPAHPEAELKSIEDTSRVKISDETIEQITGRDPVSYERKIREGEGHFAVVPRKKSPSDLMYEEDFGTSFERKFPTQNHLIAMGATGAVGLIGLILFLIFHTVTHQAKVTSTQWNHTTEVQRNQVMHHDGWDPPFDAFNVHDQGRRWHHNDHVIDHYDTVVEHYTESCNCTTTPRTCTNIPQNCTTTSRSCTSNKNGSATCTGGDRVCTGGGQSCTGGDRVCQTCDRTRNRQDAVYRDDPVYRDYYDWDVWEWVHNRTLYSSGTNTKPYPPSVEQINLGPKERRSDEETYELTFTDDDDHVAHKYTPKSLAEFQTLPVGTPKTIEIGSLGGVEISKEQK